MRLLAHIYVHEQMAPNLNVVAGKAHAVFNGKLKAVLKRASVYRVLPRFVDSNTSCPCPMVPKDGRQ